MGKLSWLSKREKVMLGFLGVGAIILTSYFFLYQPLVDKITELEEKSVQLQREMQKADLNISMIPDVEEEIKDLDKDIDIIKGEYFGIIAQEHIILLLNDLLNESGVIDGSINFSDIDYTQLNEDFPEHNEQSMDVAINYFGEYSEIMTFVKSLEDYEKVISVDSIAFSNSGDISDEPKLGGSINISFKAEPAFDLSDIILPDWEIEGEYGVDNPFIILQKPEITISTGSSSGIIGTIDLSNITEGGNATTQTVELDFFVSVRPEAADTPSILVGYAHEFVRGSSLRKNSNEIEDVEFIFSQSEDGEYQVSYRTSESSYPADGEMAVFNTQDDDAIRIGILSTKRIMEDDLSGLRLNINNTTDKKVEIWISNDDETSPRVEVTGNEGGYEIMG